jgi:hypothetical protein
MIEQASLVIGNDNFAVKENSFLGYALNQNLYVPREMDVVRATTATLVNSEGLIEQVAYNLLQQSQTFDNAAWVKTNTTLTANSVVAPNGTLTADLVSLVDTTSRLTQSLSLGAGTYTMSLYVKNESGNGVWRLRATVDGVETTFLNVFPTDSWQRFEVTFNANLSVTGFVFRGVANTGDVAIWGAQLVTGSTAKDYFPTTDRLDVPRVDYSNGTPSILVEPQRTNLALRSEEFANASWVKASVNATANNAISPTGLQDAELLTTSASGLCGLYQLIATGSGTFSFSAFAKKGNNNYFAINIQSNSSNNCTAVFDLSDGTLGEYQTEGSTAYVSHKIENYGNGWYRCTIVFSTTTSSTYFFPMFAPLKTGNSFTSSGEVNGNTSGKTIYLFGTQLEAGSYATSYIPTTSASVTRNADVISKTSATDLIGQSEGTIFAEVNLRKSSILGFLIQLSDGTNNNRVQISFDNSLFWQVTGNNLLGINGSFNFVDNSLIKIAFGYKNGDSIFYINGVEATSLGKTSANVPLSLNRIDFAKNHTSNFPINCNINKALLFKTRLSNDELQQLTTL